MANTARLRAKRCSFFRRKVYDKRAGAQFRELKYIKGLGLKSVISVCKRSRPDISKGYLVCQKWYIRGEGLDLGAEPLRIKLC